MTRPILLSTCTIADQCPQPPVGCGHDHTIRGGDRHCDCDLGDMERDHSEDCRCDRCAGTVAEPFRSILSDFVAMTLQRAYDEAHNDDSRAMWDHR